jgi:hypothetical protein
VYFDIGRRKSIMCLTPCGGIVPYLLSLLSEAKQIPLNLPLPEVNGQQVLPLNNSEDVGKEPNK